MPINIKEKKYRINAEYMDVEINMGPVPVAKERSPKNRPSSISQKRKNQKRSKKRLERCIKGNFGEDGLFVTLTYNDDNLPSSPKEAKRAFNKYCARLCYFTDKNGLPRMKCLYVVSDKDKNGNPKRLHIHCFFAGVSPTILRQKWNLGLVHIQPFKIDSDGDIAGYLHGQHAGFRAWSGSQNLIHIEEEVSENQDCPDAVIKNITKLANEEYSAIKVMYPDWDVMGSPEISRNLERGSVYAYIRLKRNPDESAQENKHGVPVHTYICSTLRKVSTRWFIRARRVSGLINRLPRPQVGITGHHAFA